MYISMHKLRKQIIAQIYYSVIRLCRAISLLCFGNSCGFCLSTIGSMHVLGKHDFGNVLTSQRSVLGGEPNFSVHCLSGQILHDQAELEQCIFTRLASMICVISIFSSM